jgi:hypothetical protein
MRIRRSRQEIIEVVEHFRASGISRAEFCRRSGIPLSTLNNYCRRQAKAGGAGLVRVELQQQSHQTALAVVLSNERRIEVGASFDESVLLRLIRTVEAA